VFVDSNKNITTERRRLNCPEIMTEMNQTKIAERVLLLSVSAKGVKGWPETMESVWNCWEDYDSEAKIQIAGKNRHVL
jgi:hypothetical protein